MKDKIAILTVNYNSDEKIAGLIASLKKSSYKNLILYVVDNASKPESFENLKKIIKKSKIKAKLIKSEKNLGWGMGCNLGFKEILKEDIEYTLVVVSDTILEKDTIAECLKVMKKDPKAGICGTKIINSKGEIQSTGGKINLITKLTGITFENKGRRGDRVIAKLRENEFVDDCAWMIRSSLMSRIKYPNYLFLYFEEIYITKMARRNNFEVYYNPDAKVVHEDYGSSGGNKNPIPSFYLNRNRIIFIKDFFPLFLPLALIFYLLLVTPFMVLLYAFRKRKDLIKFILLGVSSGLCYVLFRKRIFLFKEEGKYILRKV